MSGLSDELVVQLRFLAADIESTPDCLLRWEIHVDPFDRPHRSRTITVVVLEPTKEEKASWRRGGKEDEK